MRAFTHLFSVLLLFFVQLIFAQNHLTLEDYRSLAKNNSPLLNDFNNQRFSLKLDSLKLRADYGVKVNGLGDASYSPLFGSWGYNGSVAAGQNLAALVRVSKELLGKKNKETRFSNYSLSIQQLLNRVWVAENLPADIAERTNSGKWHDKSDLQRWACILGKRGWFGISWPKEY